VALWAGLNVRHRTGYSGRRRLYRALIAWALHASFPHSRQATPLRDVACALIENSSMLITRSGTQPSGKGPAEYFTGIVRVDPLFPANQPARANGGSVTFEPAARTAWHVHPLGQTLIVTSGYGRIQEWGGPVQDLRPGDVVWIPPGVKHWHGASPTVAMTHIAIQEHVDGSVGEFLEHVSDEQYESAASTD
jgi:quercetin dioxygenase-like cupin family protein